MDSKKLCSSIVYSRLFFLQNILNKELDDINKLNLEKIKLVSRKNVLERTQTLTDREKVELRYFGVNINNNEKKKQTHLRRKILIEKNINLEKKLLNAKKVLDLKLHI